MKNIIIIILIMSLIITIYFRFFSFDMPSYFLGGAIGILSSIINDEIKKL